jgi:two-component sensor histidine kinase
MAKPSQQSEGENISGYIRRLFKENPKWLAARSNDEILARWLKDHPGEKEVPHRVKKNLSNVKSLLRQAQRKKPGKPQKESQPAAPTAATSAAAPRSAVRGLETLEEQLDECLTLAKNLDREGLSSVINLLRRARNEVVWKMGE